MIKYEARVQMAAALYADDLNAIPNYEGFTDARLLKAWRDHFGDDAPVPLSAKNRRAVLEDSLSE